MKYTNCTKCSKPISNNNIEKHSLSCTGKVLIKGQCKHCNIIVENNLQSHSKFCDMNPNKKSNLSKLKKARDNINEISIKNMSNKIKELHKNGKYSHIDRATASTGKKHSEETKELISLRALNSSHVRKCKKSHQYKDKNNRVFIFDSSWEDELANRLDILDIKWNRPDPISYKDKNGTMRNYFPDFYLPDYNLYIDPKNSWCEQQQKEKLEIVSNMIRLIILRSLDECKNFDFGDLGGT